METCTRSACARGVRRWSRQTYRVVVQQEYLHLRGRGACRGAVSGRHHLRDVAGDGLYNVHGGVGGNGLLWGAGKGRLAEFARCWQLHTPSHLLDVARKAWLELHSCLVTTLVQSNRCRLDFYSPRGPKSGQQRRPVAETPATLLQILSMIWHGVLGGRVSSLVAGVAVCLHKYLWRQSYDAPRQTKSDAIRTKVVCLRIALCTPGDSCTFYTTCGSISNPTFGRNRAKYPSSLFPRNCCLPSYRPLAP